MTRDNDLYQGSETHHTHEIGNKIIYKKIIIELKALKDVDDQHRAQVFNYLKASRLKVGLLINFGHYPRATIDRIIL